MWRRLLLPVFVVTLAPALPAQQSQTVDSATLARIRAEEMDHSQIMWIEHFLADVYGPRPIGSPNHVAAANWALKAMTSFGMKNAHLEPFTWRGVGWMPGRATGFITSPVTANIKFESAPWAPSTHGTVSGNVVSVVAPEDPTPAELQAYLVKMAPRVKGGIVMVGPPPAAPVDFNERPMRIPDSVLKARYQGTDFTAGRGGRGNGFGGRGGRGAPPAPEPGHLSAQEVSQALAALVRDNMPALQLIGQTGGRIPGVIVAQNRGGQVYDDTTPQPPTVILRNDDYGRIYRILQDSTPVRVEFNVANQYFPQGKTSYVTVAEIPGTDKADEVVMMGGHLDSWTSATGATDNAIGCAIMMEAARILEAIGAKPRRTIRVALWSGEEEGLLGSFAYVANHFGSAEAPKPEFSKLDAYWNIDDGTGQVRGATIFGPPAAAQVVADYLKPFEDWGVFGALPSTARVEGGSDNGAFDVAGLPGIGAQQDPIVYNSTTWHTNLDNYERIVPQDVMRNAVITASLMLDLANRDEMVPRFSAADMPAVPAARGGRGGFGVPQLTAVPHVFVMARNTVLAIHAPGVLGAPGRGETTQPTPALVSKPAHGRAVLGADGALRYTPARGFVGTDMFTYRETRDTVTSPEATVTVVVR